MRFVLYIVVALFTLVLSNQMRRKGMMPQLAKLGIGPGTLKLVSLVAFILAALQTITIVAPGTVGVVKLFGQVNPEPLNEGVNVRNPFAEIIHMSIKVQRRN